MKKIFKYLLIICFFGTIYSCERGILQAPDTTGLVNLNKVYSSATNAISALMANYRHTLEVGWNIANSGEPNIGWYHGTVGGVAGELSRGLGWHGCYVYAATGPSAQPNSLVTLSNYTSLGVSISNFSLIYPGIRANWLVKENIDIVPDMDAPTKAYVKAEAMGLNAYWYLQLFKNYGGMPLVKNSLLPTDSLNIPRATLQQTLDYTLQLCDSAIAGLPDAWPAVYNGRLTRGAAMAIKAQVLLFAARPLFNSVTPILSLGANNNLICFGTADPNRWNEAITASETALAWATANGKILINTGGGVGIPNVNAFADYGTATSTPSNQEIILACHRDETNDGTYYNTSNYWTSSRYNNQAYGLLRQALIRYYKADGTEQSWPSAADAAPRLAADYITRFKQMEPRFQADFTGPGIDAANNLGDNNWSAKGWNLPISNNGSVFPQGNATTCHGTATQTKFYYKAGSRLWFEFPIFRVAELYLNLAEAYNEVGQTAKALANLNMVHNRAGLPSITETDQTKLRAIIQREWAVEFMQENKRYYDARHWRLNIGSADGNTMYGPQEEFQFDVTSTSNATVNLPTNLKTYWSFVAFTSYYHPKMYLEPIPLAEMNKGYLIQNPGY
jgi:hypothetical protein